MSHCVLLKLPKQVQKLPLTGAVLKANKTWADGVRIIATLRCGQLTSDDKKSWKLQWNVEKTKEMTQEEDDADTESEEDALDTAIVRLPPKRSARGPTGGITPGLRPTPVKPTTATARQQDSKSTAMVTVEYAGMPQKGEQVTNRSSTWKETTVTSVQFNFAEFEHLDRHGKNDDFTSFRPGCSFQIKFKSSQADKYIRTTTFYVWAVGMKYGKSKRSNHPRTVVLQRQVGDKPVGPLESWSAFHLSVAPAFYNQLVIGKKLKPKDYPAEWDTFMYKHHVDSDKRTEKMKRIVRWTDSGLSTCTNVHNPYEEPGVGKAGKDDDPKDDEAHEQPARKKRKTHDEPEPMHNQTAGGNTPFPSARVTLPFPNVPASVPGPNFNAQADSGDARYLKHIESQLKETEDAKKAAEAASAKAAAAATIRQDSAVETLVKTMADQLSHERSRNAETHQVQQQMIQQQANQTYYSMNLQANTNAMHQQHNFMLQLHSNARRDDVPLAMDRAWQSCSAVQPVQPPYIELQPPTPYYPGPPAQAAAPGYYHGHPAQAAYPPQAYPALQPQGVAQYPALQHHGYHPGPPAQAAAPPAAAPPAAAPPAAAPPAAAPPAAAPPAAAPPAAPSPAQLYLALPPPDVHTTGGFCPQCGMKKIAVDKFCAQCGRAN